MLNACAEAHAFASLTQWKCSILGVLLPFLALNWLNIRFFLCWAPKLNFCGEICQFLTLKLKFFHSFGPKTEIKTIIFFKLVNFWLYTQLFSQFLAHKILFVEKIDQFFTLILNFPQIIGPAQPQLVPFFWKIGQFLAFILNFSTIFDLKNPFSFFFSSAQLVFWA